MIEIRWNLRAILICIYLMAKNSERFKKYFSVSDIQSFENSLFSLVPHFKIELFLFMMFIF